MTRPDPGSDRPVGPRAFTCPPLPSKQGKTPALAAWAASGAATRGGRARDMRILITNDDGINAPGLQVLHEIATEIAGATGEVWTVAPAFEQSGVGHCISYTHPMMIAKLAPRRYAAEGSPADCVLAGIYDVFQGRRPDLVLSGVNRGNNAGENVLYSGTIGGAMEAALQGVPAIALSQFMGPETNEIDDPFEAARVHGAKVVRVHRYLYRHVGQCQPLRRLRQRLQPRRNLPEQHLQVCELRREVVRVHRHLHRHDHEFQPLRGV